MYCPNGHQNREGANFCRICGVPLNTPGGKSGKSSRSVFVVIGIIALVLAGIGMMANADKPEETPAVTTPAVEAPVITPPTEVPTYEPTYAPATEPDNYIAQVSGRFESVRIQDGSSTLNVHAFVFNETLVRCEQMTIYMEVEMQNGTKCYDWNVWVRRNGTFEKYTKIHLDSGDGALEETVYFSTPTTIDAVVVTPTVAGGYSWKMSLGIFDVWLDD